MKRLISAVMIVVVALGAQDLAAQRRGPPQDGPGADRRARMERMIRGRFDAMVRQQLELTDEQSQRLREVLDGFRERRRTFVEDERSTRRRLMALGDEGEITEERASEALEDLLRLKEDEVRLIREEQEALTGVLSARQLLRFVVMREQLNQRIQNIRGGGGRPMGPPPGRLTTGPHRNVDRNHGVPLLS